MDYFQSLLSIIKSFPLISYSVVFLVALLETVIGIGWILPGSTIILLMGALAANGYFDIGDLLLAAICGAILGDNINYFIGRKYGTKVFQQGFWFVKPKHFQQGEKFFKKHGRKSVFIGRFVPSLKEIIPLIAGVFKMRRLPFMVWNALGAVGWSIAWILSGYFFAHSLKLAQMWLDRFEAILVVSVLGLIVFLVWKELSRVD
ncbi:MAG TPA: DedA family protein [Candidatus Portnoybacteria bacterium]|nr:DedA family protein [Candidatus Portnoybacteria bacterium]